MEEELVRIQEGLLASQVVSVVLHGPWLALRAYPADGTRPVNRIDLLVRNGELRQITPIFASMGYEQDPDDLDTSSTGLQRHRVGPWIRFRSASRHPVHLYRGGSSINDQFPSSTDVLRLRTGAVCVPPVEMLLADLTRPTAWKEVTKLRRLHDIHCALEHAVGALEGASAVATQQQALRLTEANQDLLWLTGELTGSHQMHAHSLIYRWPHCPPSGFPGTRSRLVRHVLDAMETHHPGTLRTRETLATRRRPRAPSLVDLAVRYGCDKAYLGYLAHYERIFAPIRHQRLTFLEIGIGGHADPQAGGASMRMWKAFFPKGEIYGIDLYDKSPLEEPRISTFRGDQGDPDFLRDVVSRIGPVNVVIDDGSHVGRDVVTSFLTLFPLLSDDGIYAVEDLQAAQGPRRDLDIASTDTIAWFKALVDSVNSEPGAGAPGMYFAETIRAIDFHKNLAVVFKRRKLRPFD